MNALQLAEKCGVTYRQIDNWTRKGWLKANGGGTGNERWYSHAEQDVAQRMSELVRLGMTPRCAASFARGDKEVVEPLMEFFSKMLAEYEKRHGPFQRSTGSSNEE